MDDCEEPGRISWQDPNYAFLHLRFDGCICDDSIHRKCDCIIFRSAFRSRNNDKIVLFVIETKGRSPRVSEVKDQIEYCIETIIGLLPNPKNQFNIVPVLCARRITPHIKETVLHNKVKVFGEKNKKAIALRLYRQSINALVKP